MLVGVMTKEKVIEQPMRELVEKAIHNQRQIREMLILMHPTYQNLMPLLYMCWIIGMAVEKVVEQQTPTCQD